MSVFTSFSTLYALNITILKFLNGWGHSRQTPALVTQYFFLETSLKNPGYVPVATMSPLLIINYMVDCCVVISVTMSNKWLIFSVHENQSWGPITNSKP